MSIAKKAFKGGIWLSGFTGLSQLVSWAATIFVARMLVPGDYSLMDRATILTGYVQIFNQLGIGAAIIQRKEVNDDELSSLFWLLITWGVFLGGLCLVLAYPTVAIYDEPRVFPITQAVSVLFLLGVTFIVPRNILHRQFRFKAFGFVMSTSVIVSCGAMLVMAFSGFGVWTLIGGQIIRETVQVVLVFCIVGWKPKFHCSWREALPYIKFGLPIIGGNSVRYVYSKADIYFGGRTYGDALGFYSLAQRLAEIPSLKILTLIHNVSLPVLSRYQNDSSEFNNFFLKLVNMVAFIVLPLYAGGIFLAHELIPVVLGDKWLAAALPFQLLCIGHLIKSLLAPTQMANTAQARPHWTLYLNLACLPVMILGFYLSVGTGNLALLAIPWALLHPLLLIVYSCKTIKKLELGLGEFLHTLRQPFIASMVMIGILIFYRIGVFPQGFTSADSQRLLYVVSAVAIGGLWYMIYLFFIQKEFVRTMLRMMKP